VREGLHSGRIPAGFRPEQRDRGAVIRVAVRATGMVSPTSSFGNWRASVYLLRRPRNIASAEAETTNSGVGKKREFVEFVDKILQSIDRLTHPVQDSGSCQQPDEVGLELKTRHWSRVIPTSVYQL
jgi:hypothetical protein